MTNKENMVRRSYCLPQQLLKKVDEKKPEHQKTAEFVRNLIALGLKHYK